MDSKTASHLESLETFALQQNAVEVGQSCKKKSFKVKKKAFVYIGEGKGGVGEVMLKLKASLSQAEQLQQAQPDCCKVGKGGWVTLRFDPPSGLDCKLIESWIEESYSLLS